MLFGRAISGIIPSSIIAPKSKALTVLVGLFITSETRIKVFTVNEIRRWVKLYNRHWIIQYISYSETIKKLLDVTCITSKQRRDLLAFSQNLDQFRGSFLSTIEQQEIANLLDGIEESEKKGFDYLKSKCLDGIDILYPRITGIYQKRINFFTTGINRIVDSVNATVLASRHTQPPINRFTLLTADTDIDSGINYRSSPGELSLSEGVIGKIQVRVRNIESGTQPKNGELKQILSRLRDFPNIDLIQDLKNRVEILLANPSYRDIPIAAREVYASDGLQVSTTRNADTERYIQYIGLLLNQIRDVSSGYKNTAKEKRSAGDGSFRQDVLTPLLSGLSSLIASGDIDVNNFSWSEVCDKFDFHSDKYHWAVFSRLISRKNEIGDFQTNCIRLLTIIEDYADTVDTPLLVVQMALKKYLEENPLPSIAPN